MTTYTIFASTDDDYIDSSNTSYSSAVAGSNLALSASNPGGADPLHLGVTNTVSGGTFFIDETFLIFDTSSIPTSEVVTGVTLSLDLYQDFSDVDFTCEARGYSCSDPPVTGDFRTPTQLGALTLLATLATSGIGATGAYKSFAENGTSFRSYINRGGSTRFVVAADNTRTQTAPTGPTQNEYVIFYSADNTGTTLDPKVVITTTPGAPANTVLPAITGTAQVGQTLTASQGTWSGTPTSYAYQWNRAGVAIGGATSSTYVPVSADVGSTLTVTVTATNATGSTPATSAATAAVVPASNVGVTSSPGSINTTAGQTIYWRARAIVSVDPGNGDVSPWSTTQNFVISGNPAPISAPAITGTPVVGNTLTVSNGTWSGSPTSYTYQWRRDGVNLGGATTASYALVSADANHRIDCVVTATNGTGSTNATAPSVGPITGPGPLNTSPPTVIGSPVVGVALTVDVGTWTGTPTSYTYQWRWHDTAANIVGATSASYTLVSGDLGHTIDCVVTATNGSGSNAATSTPTAAVTTAVPTAAALPSIVGYPLRAGSTVTATTGTWSGSPTGYGYQWRWQDTSPRTVISGATGSQYTLQAPDVGHLLEVVVTASNASGPGQAVSPAVGPIAAVPPTTAAPTVPRWQFLAVTTAGAGLAELTAATNRHLTFDLYKPATASFDMNGRHAQAAIPNELAGDLLVIRSGRRLFLGRLGASGDELDGTGHKSSFGAVDYQGMLARRIIWPGSTTTFTQRDQRDIAWQLITDTQRLGDLGITTTTAPTGVLRDRAYNEGDVIGDLVTQLSQVLGGFDWEIDANKRFNVWYPQRGRPAGQGATLTHGSNVTKVSRTVDPSNFANAIRYSGATGIVPALATVAPGPEGRWEKQVGDPSINQSQTLADHANFELALNSIVLPSYTVTLTRGWWSPDLVWLGDYVTLIVHSGRLNVAATLRVITVDITIDDTGVETVQVTLGQSRGSLFDRLGSYAQRFQDLERR